MPRYSYRQRTLRSLQKAIKRLVEEKFREEKRRQKSAFFVTFSGSSTTSLVSADGGGATLQPFLNDLSLTTGYPMKIRSRVLRHPPIRKAIKLSKLYQGGDTSCLA